MSEAILHMAAEPDGLVQKCSRCGYMLADNRNVMVLSSDDSGPGFWQEGPVTVWPGNPTQLAAGGHDNAIPCDARIQ